MGCKYLLDANESAVYCGHNLEDAGDFLNLVVMKIMEEQCCTMLDLINFDCAIHYVIVKPAGYGAVHGWTEAQVQRMYIESRSDGHWVHLGPPINLIDEGKDVSKIKESNKCSGCRYRGRPSFVDPCNNCDDYGRPGRITKDDKKGEKEMDCYEEDLMEIDRNSVIPKRIWFNEHDGKFYTTVEWKDGIKTTVAEDDKERLSQYGGFTAALAKRIFGTGESICLMNRAVDKANEKKKLREQRREGERRLKQRKRELEAVRRKEEHEARVREEVERLRAEREAKRRILGDQLDAFVNALSMFNRGLDKKEDHAE